jgi:hypothetical protein
LLLFGDDESSVGRAGLGEFARDQLRARGDREVVDVAAEGGGLEAVLDLGREEEVRAPNEPVTAPWDGLDGVAKLAEAVDRLRDSGTRDADLGAQQLAGEGLIAACDEPAKDGQARGVQRALIL